VSLLNTYLLPYLFSGPFAWLILWWATSNGRAKVARLLKWRGTVPDHPPHVTILIPAKDEAPGIRQCLDAVLAQDWPRFDVVVVDDRSTDQTGAILDEIAARDPRVRVMHIRHGGLPTGWLGKCNALHVGTRQARGEWLFFVDSDVTLAPNALTQALSLCISRKYDALSILTRLECHRFLERLMLPPLAAAWTVMHSISLTNEDSSPDRAEANGQFFLIRREAYESVKGHEAVKDQITEDVELARLLKANEFRVRLMMAPHLAATRMHSNLRQMFNGWARIYSGTARRKPWRILCAMWFILTAVFTFYPALVYALATLDGLWLAAAGAHFFLMTAWLMYVYRWSGNPMRHALLAAISGAIIFAILVYSLRKCQTGRITWRDTVFSAPPGAQRQ
jgi:cellulose synthase/poly-beta-1,6-N-acetylglucosamine synthase-like glycosyltransferase